jgi:hypothetical protein
MKLTQRRIEKERKGNSKNVLKEHKGRIRIKYKEK